MTTTKIYVILDKSGSMEECRNDTIEGFNSFVKKQREDNSGEVLLSLIQFDNKYEINYENRNINDVEDLNLETFQPNGTTALFDAIGRTINEIQQWIGEKIIVVIITDGEENSSVKYGKNEVNEMISERKSKGWEFVFLGANQDAIKEAEKIGIGADSALTYSTDAFIEAFDSLSGAISRSRSTPMRSISFTPDERERSFSKKNYKYIIYDRIEYDFNNFFDISFNNSYKYRYLWCKER